MAHRIHGSARKGWNVCGMLKRGCLFPVWDQIDELCTAHLRAIQDGCMEEARRMMEDDGIAEVFIPAIYRRRAGRFPFGELYGTEKEQEGTKGNRIKNDSITLFRYCREGR
ncbi:MAG: hypothetical protein V9F01_17460 [Chitinophagaceae bacterium]